MCLGVPMKIVSIHGDMAQVEIGGVVRPVSLALIEGVEVGNYVIVHAGYAIERLDEENAKETLALLSELEKAAEDDMRDLTGGQKGEA